MSSDAPPRLVCGLDLGGTKLLGVVLDADAPVDPSKSGRGVLAEHRVPTPHDGVEALASALADIVATLRAEAQSKLGGDLTAVGLGAPGLVDRDGVRHTGPNLPGITRFGFAERLTADTGLPAVVDNDATCAAWGEHERGASAGQNHSILITLGTGIGAGITVKGEVLRGANGFAGEPGHMIVDPGGPPCPCGRRGCWERYGSGSGLARLGRDAAHAGLVPRVVELAGGDAEDVRGEHVTQAAGEGCEGATEVLRQFGWWVALGIANLVAILDSEMVVIGGGLVASGDLVLDPIRAAFPSLLFGGPVRPEVPIVQAALGEHAGAIGAALLAAQRTG
jgi:glucokinase